MPPGSFGQSIAGGCNRYPERTVRHWGVCGLAPARAPRVARMTPSNGRRRSAIRTPRNDLGARTTRHRCAELVVDIEGGCPAAPATDARWTHPGDARRRTATSPLERPSHGATRHAETAAP